MTEDPLEGSEELESQELEKPPLVHVNLLKDFIFLGYSKISLSVLDEVRLVFKTVNDIEVEWIRDNFKENTPEWWDAYISLSLLSIDGQFVDAENRPKLKDIFSLIPFDGFMALFKKVMDFQHQSNILGHQEIYGFSYTDHSRMLWKGCQDYISNPTDMYPRFGIHPVQAYWIGLNKIIDTRELGMGMASVGAMIIGALSAKAGKSAMSGITRSYESEKRKAIARLLGGNVQDLVDTFKDARERRMKGILDFHDRAVVLSEAATIKDLYVKKYVSHQM